VDRPSGSETVTDDDWFLQWRRRELARVDRAGIAYLDYTGAALYPASLVQRDTERLANSVVGNPHSRAAPSLAATRSILEARHGVLEFLNADEGEYTVIFTANASAACKLVGESFPFRHSSVFALAADNHNSVVGIREYALARGANIEVLPLDHDLRLPSDQAARLRPAPPSPSLLAFPAQSNFSGVRHPLELVATARRLGWRVLLDAAAYLPTANLNLRLIQPDFVCLSLYKIAGYPTGVGALVARHDAMRALQRPAFSGGTVQWVSLQHGRHMLLKGAEGFEDGSPAFLALGAVSTALTAVRDSGRERLGRHLAQLTEALLHGLITARHLNGSPRIRLHGPHDTYDRGATVAFTVLDDAGRPVPFWIVEELARGAGIAVRGGCFCNPGCAERAFGFDVGPTLPCLDVLGDDFTIPRFAECMEGHAVGAVRVSMGLGSVASDVERLLSFVETI
jgi:selenocysteine lyase/cysteine desulfurase